MPYIIQSSTPGFGQIMLNVRVVMTTWRMSLARIIDHTYSPRDQVQSFENKYTIVELDVPYVVNSATPSIPKKKFWIRSYMINTKSNMRLRCRWKIDNVAFHKLVVYQETFVFVRMATVVNWRSVSQNVLAAMNSPYVSNRHKTRQILQKISTIYVRDLLHDLIWLINCWYVKFLKYNISKN